MRKLRDLVSSLRSSLWFIPSLLVFVGVMAAMVFTGASASLGQALTEQWPSVFGAGADGARGVLEAVATSMITTAGVVFSITIVALSLASTQYTSRLLRNFMRDRTNQTVLGVFVGIFAYCLVVLRTIRGGDNAFVPTLAVSVAVLLAFVGIGYLIYFIHHIASAIQAAHVLSTVTDETLDEVDRLFPETIGEPALPDDREPIDLAALTDGRRWTMIPARRSGYFQWVDDDEAFRLAREHDGILWFRRMIGEFVVEGTPIAAITADGGDADELARRVDAIVSIRRQRTIEHDVSFGFRQIVDVAVKALSPGINDSTTAVMSVHQATVVLARLARRHAVSPYREDNGELRVVAFGHTFTSLLDDAFDQIRQNAGGNPYVLGAMVRGLAEVERVTAGPRRRESLKRQLQRVTDTAERTIAADYDREDVIREGTSLALALGRPLGVLS